MALGGNRDREIDDLELTETPWPAPPLNLSLSGEVERGFALTWDDPFYLTLNSVFNVLGVNVYRSFDSEFGPYTRVTELPLGATFWHDITDNEVVIQENVTDRFLLFGAASAGREEKRYIFRTLNCPIVKEASQQIPTSDPRDVQVFVDGQRARVLRVHGETGEIELDVNHYPDVTTQSLEAPVVPTAQSLVTCTYRYTRSFLRTDLAQRVFYRVTTVGVKVGCNLALVQPQDLVETPLEHAAATNALEVEKLDWIWREAVRRNRWILEQGGERVKVFLRKNVGLPCPCRSNHHKQSLSDCLRCFGTGIVGGYEGPYELLIAPDDAERRLAQKEIGRTVEHAYEVWTGPQPLLSQRDFLVKRNGDRYSIGGVRMPSNRGMLLQQHFNIGVLDEKDIRYKVPMGNPIKFAATQFAPRAPEYGAPSEVTEHPDIGDEREYRGLTQTWKNTTYGVLFLFWPVWNEVFRSV